MGTLILAVHEYHVQHNTEATEKKSYDAVQGFEYSIDKFSSIREQWYI